MKNKEKYKLTNLKFKTIVDKSNTYRLPVRHWQVLIYEDGVIVDHKNISGGGIADVMTWLERECDEG